MDSSVTEALVDRYYAPLYRFALSLAASEALAADLTQETFYLWAAKGHQLRDASKAKAWLFTTLHREFLRQRRHQIRFPTQEIGESETELPPVDAGIAGVLDGSQALAALQRVDERYRVPLVLFYVEDFSYQEIAEALELPVGTVMSRLARGKDQLRRLLAEPATGDSRDRPQAPDNVVPFQRAAPG